MWVLIGHVQHQRSIVEAIHKQSRSGSAFDGLMYYLYVRFGSAKFKLKTTLNRDVPNFILVVFRTELYRKAPKSDFFLVSRT